MLKKIGQTEIFYGRSNVFELFAKSVEDANKQLDSSSEKQMKAIQDLHESKEKHKRDEKK